MPPATGLPWHGDQSGADPDQASGRSLPGHRPSGGRGCPRRNGRARPDASPDAIAQTIARHGVAYLLIDEDRYLNAPSGPLGRFVAERPEACSAGLEQRADRACAMAIYEVLPEHEAGAAGSVEPTSRTQ